MDHSRDIRVRRSGGVVPMIAIDSEFQSLIPPLSDDEYQRLEKSILTDGYHEWEPIVTWNGTIVDGHNRYHICDEHGIKPTQVEQEFESRDAAKIWIIEHQFGRRNLSTYNRAQLALQLEPLYAAENKRRQQLSHGRGKKGCQKSADLNFSPMRTDERLADIAGTSRDTIRKVKVIENEAANGNETAIEAKQAVMSGEKSIHKAFTEIRNNGDKADTRKLCTVCGKPIDDGDCYDHDQLKHKACAYKLEKERDAQAEKQKSAAKKPKYTEDGRRICTVCGEPIDDGDFYISRPTRHKKCHNQYNNELQYVHPDRSLLENVATYTTQSLVTELTSSAESMRDAMMQSLSINETMGVSLTKAQKRQLNRAIDSIFKAIKNIER